MSTTTICFLTRLSSVIIGDVFKLKGAIATMKLPHSIIFGLILSSPWLTATAKDDFSVQNFESSLTACERGLQAKMPRSKGALRVLESQFKKYERYRDAALKANPALNSAENKRYTGDFFVELSYKEAFTTCERDFTEKMLNARQIIEEKMAKRQERLEKQRRYAEAVLKKTEQAKVHVQAAIDQACVTYLLTPTTPPIISPLYAKFKGERQKSIDTYAEIVKQYYSITVIDRITNEKMEVSKTIALWFEYCDDAFNHKLSLATADNPAKAAKLDDLSAEEEAVGPLPPTNIEEESTAEATTDEENRVDASNDVMETDNEDIADTEDMMDEEDAEMEEDPEYAKALKTYKGGKFETLDNEGRLPDFTDHEDNNLKIAKIWQYETEDGSECITYTFKGNKVTKRKESRGECPELY